jgi:hypothetical protein
MPRLLALITLFLLALAASAAADTHGGAEAGGGAVAPTGGHVATVTDGRITFAARSDAVLGKVVRFRGHVPTSDAGRAISIERFDDRTTTWVAEAAAVVKADGAFVARWRTDHIGRFRLRATVGGAGEAHASGATPELSLTVYKPAKATWYGPGFYGRTTACGLRMTTTLVGVAHKTLPCGTKVAVFYKGRAMTVPVVDRGPFRNGASWDLTYAAANALGFKFTDVIGAVSLREPVAR